MLDSGLYSKVYIGGPKTKPGNKMTSKHQVEIFTAGCQLCDDAVALVNKVAQGKSDVTVHKMQEVATASRAKALGVTSVPAVVINGKLAACCSGRGIDEAVLRIAGLGS